MNEILSIPIVQRCITTSVNIANYFDEELYRADVTQVEELTPDFISILAIGLVLDELSQMGIETNIDATDLLTNSIDLEVMFYLRNKLDKDKFYKFIKTFTPEKYAEFTNIIDDCATAEDLLIELTDFCRANIPLDVGWEYIERALDNWYSTKLFSQHIVAIIGRVDNSMDINDSSVTDQNIGVIAQYIGYMQERQRKVNILSSYISRQFRCDMVVLDNLVSTYDKDKLRPDKISVFAEEFATHSTDESAEDIEHHQSVYHHYEYWDVRYEQYKQSGTTELFVGPTLEQGIMILISLILDDLRGPKLSSALSRFTVFNPPVIKQLLDICDIDWDEVITGGIRT